MAALISGHEDVARAILQRPRWSSVFYRGTKESPAWDVLSPWNVLEHNAANALPRNNEASWKWPMSRMVREDLKEFFVPLAGGQDYEKLHNRAEYRTALAWLFAPSELKEHAYPATGDYLGEYQWTNDSPPDSIWAVDFKTHADMAGWGFGPLNAEWFTQQLGVLSKQLYEMRGWRS